MQNSSDVNHEYWNGYWNDNIIRYYEISSGERYFFYLIKKILACIDRDEVSSVMDLCCGVGNKTRFFAKYFPYARVTGGDFTEAAISAAKSYYKSVPNLSFRVEALTPPQIFPILIANTI